MSEGDAPESAERAAAGLQQVPTTAGGLLRLAREREGLHIAALAVSMKVPVKKLEALESNRLDLLPDAVFVRALAGSVCRALHIDPRPVLELLPASQVPKLDVGERGINTPFSTPGQGAAFSVIGLLMKPQSMVVALLLLAAAGVLLYPESAKDDHVVEAVFPGVPMTTGGVQTTVEAPEPIATLPAAPASAASAPLAQLAPAVEIAISTPAVAASLGGASAPAAVASAAKVIPVAGPVVMQGATGSAPAVVSTADLVYFKAKGAVWVQVKDAKGIVIFSKTLMAGESASASGVTPLAVVVGRADLTSVSVRGKEFNLSAVSQDNVARFEVK